PRQNHHGWWGTVVIPDDSKTNGDSDVHHVFVKTSREAHFVSQGTAVILEDLADDVDSALRKLQGSVSETVFRLIASDLEQLKGTKVKLHKIKAIDYKETTALAKMHNLVTEVCFNNDHWLDTANDIGVDAIRIGRKLPPLEDNDGMQELAEGKVAASSN